MSDHCPTCGARVKQPRPEQPVTEYPEAKALGIRCLERELYEIAGVAGLWFACVTQADLLGETYTAKVSFFGWNWNFVRAIEAEERVKRAMQMMEEPK